MYDEFNDRTWSDMLDELSSEDMFQLEQEVAGEKMITPRWEHCLEAIKRATEEDLAHKMKHWISLLTIANATHGDDSLKELRRETMETRVARARRARHSPRSSSPSQPFWFPLFRHDHD